MSEYRINQITNQAGTAGPQVAGITTFSSSSGLVMPSGTTEYRGGRGRGLFAGGYNPTLYNIIDYVTISTTGNAKDFGDLTTSRRLLGTAASSTRGVFAGGFPTTNTIDYITISSTGNTFDFGDLTLARYGLTGASNSVRGVFFGGNPPANYIIDYITISTLGNASSFGTIDNRVYGASCASPTRAVYGSGQTPAIINTIQYITISTLGDTQDFGDLSVTRTASGSCSSPVRGIFAGGLTPADVNTIDYITLASLGDAIDFGDLTQTKHYYGSGTSSNIRGVFGGGEKYGPQTYVNDIDYITIATTGNAADFGDVTQSRGQTGDCSDAHGGLGD